ncbi:alkaline phosphatase family protein [Brevibacillus agri]|uniref:alkaline phosphatase family protein n=1 Tax=Brevibacillus agri TaxID=51101 RepID=UPI002E2263E7|nr:alkaline phosphatase family protein [Brevibacillus agri]
MKSRWTSAILWLLVLSLPLIGCKAGERLQIQEKIPAPLSSEQEQTQGPKPVVLILIDSLMDKPLQEAIRQGRAPALAFLREKGHYFPHVVSSFPTMSVTIDSTLLTGTYADQHHVPGLSWYNEQEKRMVYYGYGPKEAMKIDQPQVLLDAIWQLNQSQLNPQTNTIHDVLADQGKDSASINAIVWRGKTEHALKIPHLIEIAAQLPEELNVTGPKLLSYAAFAQLDPNQKRHTRIWRKYGMNDEFSAQETVFLIAHDRLPPLTITYLPENDMEVHRKGPLTLEGIENADKALQTVLDAFGSWDKAVEEVRWIVMGDSAQSAVQDDRQAATIDLRSLLASYRISSISRPPQATDQIVIAANERMAYVYALDPQLSLSAVAAQLQREPRMDVIARKEGQSIVVTAGGSSKQMTYKPGGPVKDEYGQTWTISGDTSVLDMTVSKKRLTYGKYPDALARLHGAMNSHPGRYVIATVQPGYELITESSPTHIGGAAHGSLHAADSLVPLLVTGTDSRPKSLRIVDLKEWLLRLVNETD